MVLRSALPQDVKDKVTALTADLHETDKDCAYGVAAGEAKDFIPVTLDAYTGIIEARKLFRANEKDSHAGEELFMMYTAAMVEDIMSDTTLTSADFMANKFLQEGDVVGKWMGFTWIPFEGIDPVSTSTYYTVAWCKSAIHFGEGYVEGRVDRRPDKKNLWQTSLNTSFAAGRQDEKGVVEIAYQ